MGLKPEGRYKQMNLRVIRTDWSLGRCKQIGLKGDTDWSQGRYKQTVLKGDTNKAIQIGLKDDTNRLVLIVIQNSSALKVVGFRVLR